MNLSHPFDTYLRTSPDFSDANAAKEVIDLSIRQNAIADCLEGQTTADYVLDVLESQGIDPTAYVDCVEANVQHVIESRVLVGGLPLEFFF